MLTRDEFLEAQRRALEFLNRAGIRLTEKERQSIEIADFGLGRLDETGLELVTYVNTKRYCAKELVLFPGQTCPEHLHPSIGSDPGKTETFRCRLGTVFLYVDGPPSSKIQARPPQGDENWYTVFHEVRLSPGDQFTIAAGTRHWFQAGPEGAVVSEFSSTSRDESDVFTDPRIRRTPVVE